MNNFELNEEIVKEEELLNKLANDEVIVEEEQIIRQDEDGTVILKDTEKNK